MPRTGLRISLDGRVAIVTVDRAKVLNALNTALMEELMHTLTDLGSDAGVGVVVLTGTGEKSFIAGADIKEMAGKTPLGGACVLRARPGDRAQAGDDAKADDRGGQRLRTRRRL